MAKDTIIYGYHAVSALLANQAQLVEQLYLLNNRKDKRIAEIYKAANQKKLSIKTLSRSELDQLCSNSKHQGMAARCQAAVGHSENDLQAILQKEGPLLFLILDGVQDPHNLGACLRSANAMGVNAVLAPKDRSVGLTPTVRKVACGADADTPFIQVTNLARTIRELQEQQVWVVGTAMDADKNIQDVDLRGRMAIVLGSEGSGIRDLTRKHCDFVARIPMCGSVESLNVSVSAGICLYEAVRQRG